MNIMGMNAAPPPNENLDLMKESILERYKTGGDSEALRTDLEVWVNRKVEEGSKPETTVERRILIDLEIAEMRFKLGALQAAFIDELESIKDAAYQANLDSLAREINDKYFGEPPSPGSV